MPHSLRSILIANNELAPSLRIARTHLSWLALLISRGM